jgi:tetratricopeptide (TPR) repeat protein
MINLVQVMALAAVLCLTGGPAYAQGAGIEWETLIEEVRTLYRAGRYDRAATVAKKALEVAEKRVGLNHPDVATSLSNLAKAHQAQGQYDQPSRSSSARWTSWKRPWVPTIPLWRKA